MSEIILIIIFLIIISGIFLLYHFLDKFGLKTMLLIMTIISYIMSFKTGKVFGIDANVNIITYMCIFTIFYITLEKYGQKQVKEDIGVITKTSIYSLFILVILLLYIQSINDAISLNINHIVDIIPSLLSFLVLPISVIFTIKLYSYLKKINDNIYINMIVCTIIVGLIESLSVSAISNGLVLDINSIIRISLANYLFKIITMIIYLPIIHYILKKKKVQL